MGIIVDASCDCGFSVKSLLIGGGMLNYKQYSGYPAICDSCSDFEILNHREESHACPKCGGHMIFYTDPSLRRLKEGFPNRASDNEGEIREELLKMDMRLSLTSYARAFHASIL